MEGKTIGKAEREKKGNSMSIITFQDYEKAADKTQWIQQALVSYRESDEYKKALDEEAYMAGKNTTIQQTVRVIYNMAGLPEPDFTASNMKIMDNTIHRLVTDRCSYSLGNGISFPGRHKVIKGGKSVMVDPVKDLLGDKFDRALKRTAYWALANSEAYLYVHMGSRKPEWQYKLFKKTEFLPLYDEESGKLRGGVRFWSMDWGKRPITAVLYLENGYIKYKTKPDEYSIASLQKDGDLQAYIETVQTSEAFGEERVESESLTMLPIFPLYSGEMRTSALDRLRDVIDATDMVLSGFVNDIHDIPQVYWLISGAMGMSEKDKRQLLDRLILQHMAVIDGENSKIEGYTQEIPYEAREKCLDRLHNKMYEKYGGFDVHTIEAGATNDHIEAGYWPMDEEADDFEYEIIEFVQEILEMMGVTEETTPIFQRNRVSNQKEQTEMVMLAANVLDKQTILEKLPWITVDEVDDILARSDEESYDRFENSPQESEQTPDEEE